jgi:hypothetical protein
VIVAVAVVVVVHAADFHGYDESGEVRSSEVCRTVRGMVGEESIRAHPLLPPSLEEWCLRDYREIIMKLISD